MAAENARPGTDAWNVPAHPFRLIEGYASEISVVPGDTVHLHVQMTPAGRYRIEIYRIGWYGGSGGRLVACLPGCSADEAGASQPVPPFDQSTGLLDAGWPVTDQLTIPTDWVSGYYLAELIITSQPGRYSDRIPFVVRAPAGRSSRILVQVPVNTWEAYNAWGGRSLYYPDQSGVTNNHVSFSRPWDQQTFAPGSQQQWELPLIRFLERQGSDVSYQTDIDTDANPGSLLQHRLVMTFGHSEYWTKGMRDAFEQARDAGTNLAFMGADESYWQIRYADASRRTLVEYRNPQQDPEPDPALKTVKFRKLIPHRPECELMGVQFHDKPGDATIGSTQDLSPNPSSLGDPWFANTGFKAGDTLHALVGGEWNAITPDCTTPPLSVLFLYTGPPGNQDSVRYVASSGARVFSAASLQFGFGLDDNRFMPNLAGYEDQRLEQFMRNALADLAKPEPPLSVAVTARRLGARVSVIRTTDPRLRAVVVYRHPGASPFTLSDPGTIKVCVSRTVTCTDAHPTGEVHTFRYAAASLDAWGASDPILSAPLRLTIKPKRTR